MALARQCDVCKKCFIPERNLLSKSVLPRSDKENHIVFPRLMGILVDHIHEDIGYDKKIWDLCEDCFEKINFYITVTLKEENKNG